MRLSLAATLALVLTAGCAKPVTWFGPASALVGKPVRIGCHGGGLLHLATDCGLGVGRRRGTRWIEVYRNDALWGVR